MSDSIRMRIKKKYKNALVKYAFLLFLYQIKYRFINYAASVFFSKRKNIVNKGRFLRLTNKVLNDNICACQLTFEKCEDYKRKIELLG